MTTCAPQDGRESMRAGSTREPEWRDARVLRVVRRHVAQARAVTERDDSGRDARAYVIDGTMVLRVARRYQFRRTASLLRESILLARVPAAARVPRTLGSGVAYGVEYGLLTRVAGAPMQGTTFVGWPRTAALAQLGATLAHLHRTRLPAAELGLFPVATVEGLREQSLLEAEDLLALCPEVDGRHVHRKIVQAWALLPREVPLGIVHGALTARSVLIDPSTLELAALVDLTEARRGPGALDLAAIWPASTRQAVLDGYRTVADLPAGLDALSGAFGILAALRKHRAHRDAKADTVALRGSAPRRS